MKIVKSSLAHEIIQKIISGINKGEYKPGDKLPSTEELAKKYGVGRSSIREALLELQALGVILLKHGEGTYVSSLFRPNQGPLKNVAEIRRMIETYCIMEIAPNVDSNIVALLHECIEQMEKNFNDSQTYMYFDRQFHFKITEATSNPMITSILKSVEILFKEIQSSVIDYPGQKSKALEEHKSILNALKLKDPDLAVRAVNIHHDSILDLWLTNFKK